jgi:hypothetical protein
VATQAASFGALIWRNSGTQATDFLICLCALSEAGSLATQPEESPAMIARLIFELVILTSALSIIIYELVTTVAEMI